MGHELRAHKCGSRVCELCGPGRGMETQRVVLGKVEAGMFKRPQMLSLTVDGNNFEGPAAAYEHVMKGEYVNRLMRVLGVKRWLWTLEFHAGSEATGYSHRGWPHWHVLMDISDRGALGPGDLKKIWRLWRDKWGLGRPDVSKERRELSPERAVRYVMKYLIKAGYVPAWFLEGKRRRMIQGSGAVGALVMGQRRRKGEGGDDDPRGRGRRAARALVERVAECRERCDVFAVDVRAETGDLQIKWVGVAEVSPADLAEVWQDPGGRRVVEGLGLRMVVSVWEGRSRVGFYLEGIRGVMRRVKALVCWLEREGWGERRRARIAWRRAWCLSVGAELPGGRAA